LPNFRSASLVAAALLVALGVGGCGGRSDAGARSSTPPERRPEGPGVRLEQVGSFEQPTYVTAPRGERRRVFVVEREGRIRVLRGGRTLDQPFLDLSEDVSSDVERGLLSMAFAPDYERSGRFYVYFTDAGGDIRVQEFRRSGASENVADPGSRRELLRIEHSKYGNHNGGQLQFGPDEMLYLAPGDGGGSGDPLASAQDLGAPLGKLLRIDPRPDGARPYAIPEDNPFVGRRGARPEVYAYGLRNPYRFSFDRETGDLTLADNGEQDLEEVDFAPRGEGRGANFGWNRFEGTRRYEDGEAPGHVEPVLTRSHEEGVCSIIGGYVIRDPALPALRGRYVYGDLCTGELRVARLTAAGAEGDRPLGAEVPSVASFGEDGTGRVYAVSLQGEVFRLAPAS